MILTTTARALFNKLDELIRQEKFDSVVNMIESVLLDGDSSRDFPVVEQGILLLYKAESLFRLCKFSASEETILRSLKILSNTEINEQFARAKFVRGQVLQALGSLESAEEEFNESYVYFKRLDDVNGMLKPLNRLANIAYLEGKYEKAADFLKRCVQLSQRSDDDHDSMAYRLNLRRIYTIQGRFAEASGISCADDARVTDDRLFQCHAFLTRAHISCLTLDVDCAAETLENAFHLIHDTDLMQEAIYYREYSGLLAYTRGNYAKAREYYHKVLDMPEPTASAVAQTLRMLTDVYIAEEKFAIAEETAVKAEAAITRINERIELGALYRAYGQIHTHKQEAESACDDFKRSIDLLREIGARYELALSYLTAGKSESYGFDERMRHLEMSRMLFIEMDVPKRVEQVKIAFAELRRAANVSAASRKDDLAAPAIITGNRQMKEILAAVERIKNTSHTVLITGETGTGKDLLAEYIHRSSTRANKPFRIVNTAAIPSELLESELFGYRKGTYTGATHDKAGLIESAEEGTFYFDEIGDAPLSVQTKILRVLDTKSVRRLGTTSDIKVNTRFIAATNLDLKQMMDSGHFRSDLYYRLQEMPLHLPPLRDRLDDIRLLVEFFLQGTGFESAATDSGTLDRLIERFNNRDWPGNIRELKFEINRMIALAPGNNIDDLLKVPSAIGKTDESIDKVSIEREHLLEVLRRNDSNQSKAARELGIHESTFRYHMRKHRIS